MRGLAAWLAVCGSSKCAMSLGCGRHDAGPVLQILGESTRLRTSDPVPATSPWFDGSQVTLVAARGEILGLQILHRGGGPVVLTLAGGATHPAASGLARSAAAA